MRSLIEKSKEVLTNFNVTNAGDSCYFKMRQYCIRVSDHIAKNSDGNIQFVQQGTKVVVWKVGVKDNNKDVGTFTEIISFDKAVSLLETINGYAKYFIP